MQVESLSNNIVGRPSRSVSVSVSVSVSIME